MKKTVRSLFSSRLKGQRGAVIVLVAVSMVAFLGLAALAIDLSHRHVVQNELQNAADAAALGGARRLGLIYQGLTFAQQQNYVCDPGTIIPTVQAIGLQNTAAQEAIVINAVDAEIGTWTPPFSQTLTRPTAVRVTTRRDGDSPIATFFASIMGINFMNVTADATAALTGVGESEIGEIELPVGISRRWFDDHPYRSNDHIVFSPVTDPNACGGWTTFEEGANAANLKKILDGGITSQDTVAGETQYNFTGGDVAAVFSNLLSLFQRKGYDVDKNGNWIYDNAGNLVRFATVAQGAVPLYELDKNGNVVLDKKTGLPIQLKYPDGTLRNKHAWETTLPVYSNLDGTADCSNPNQSKLIVGYARMRLTDVVDSPAKRVVGNIVWDYVDPDDTAGGGGMFGSLGTIPKLVE